MSILNFDQLFVSLKNNTCSLAEQSFKDEVIAAKEDGIGFLNTIKGNTEVWVQQLASGDITNDDFAYLIKSQEECGEMVALKNVGLAEVRIDEFKSGIISCIIDTVGKVI